MYYFSADLHLGHQSIITYCQRPFKSAAHMDEVIIDNWNKTVSKKDTVYFLGDFCLRNKPEKYLSKLNGKIIWIRGNHDDRKDTILDKAIVNFGGMDWQLIHNPDQADEKYLFTLCGHVHDLWKIKRTKSNRTIINVGMDVWDFKPVSIKTLLKFIYDEQSKGE